ncbi:MAG: DUF86 domain-containing protein [Magnetococcales bacterium]|nr:DUF86 domain-containing protein [Magnetococcales bacterium]
MSREWHHFLRDIVDARGRIRAYLTGVSRAQFLENRQIFDAVVLNPLIMGEAVKHLPGEVKTEMDWVEWSMAARFRDLVAHHYFALDPDLVWEIATEGLTNLADAVESYLERTANSD